MQHLVDTQALRQRGLHHEADVLDHLPPLSPLAETQAAQVIHGDPRDVAHSSAGGKSTGGSGSPQPAATPSASARSLGANGGSSEPRASIGGSGGHPGPASADSEHQSGHDEHGTPSIPHQLLPGMQDGQTIDLHDEPLAGIRSGHLREHIQRQAFVAASGTAQDSAVAHAAERLLPPELRGLLRHDVPPIDISPAARVARIEALAGELPNWARREPEIPPCDRASIPNPVGKFKPHTLAIERERER